MRKTHACSAAILVLLMTASQVPTVPSTVAEMVQGVAEWHESMPDPVSVELEVLNLPAVGERSVVQARVSAEWVDMDGALVSIEVPPGVVVQGDAEARMELRKGLARTLAFVVAPQAAGTHEIVVRAQGMVQGVQLGGEQSVFLVLPEAGDGASYVGGLPRLPYIPMWVTVSPELAVPAPAEESQEGAELPTFVEVESTLPLDPNLPPAEPDLIPESVGIQSHSTFVVHGCWGYTNEDDGFSAQRFVTIEVWDQDSSGGDDFLTSTITGSDGCFTSSAITRAEECCLGNQDVYVLFYMSNTWTSVEDSSANIHAWVSGVTTVGSEDTLEMGTGFPGTNNGEGASRLFQYVNNGGYFARNHAGVGLGSNQVTVQYPSTTCGMCYVGSTDTIHVESGEDKNPDDSAHEFGHFVHDKMYGDSYSPNPGGAHTLCEDGQNRGLSWGEGYANFFAVRANHEVVANGANGDTFYKRPWDGSGFSLDFEARICSLSVDGDDDEMNVAQAMWDLRDTTNDGLDTSSDSNTFIHDVMESCDDFAYNDYYNGGGSGANTPSCNWTSMSGSACNFVRTAFQNEIDFNTPPTSTVTSQTSFAWVSGTQTITSTLSDPESCSSGHTASYRVSSDSTCTDSDVAVGSDSTSPYSTTFDINVMGADADVWTCAKTSDGMETGGYAVSASPVGVDPTPPSTSVSVPSLTLPGAYSVAWSASDGTSGLTGTLLVQETLTPLGPSTVCSVVLTAGTPSASGSCTRNPTVPGQYCYTVIVNDVAGNTGSSQQCTTRI